MSSPSSISCSLVAPHLSNTAASVSGQSRDGVLTISSRDYKPRDTLIHPTQARLHDRLAWEMQFALAHRQYFYTRPAENDTYVPSPSLLTTTEARNNDARAWNDHVQQLHAPPVINTHLPPVKEHVLRLTKARLHEICILQARAAARERERFPRPPRYVLSTFMPSAHLLSSTTARRLDTLAWQTTQDQAAAMWQFSAARALSMAPLSEHLLLPTQSQLAATRAWADELRQAKLAADIWWEERRPAPCSDYHRRHAARLPSKVLEVTVAFSLSMRAKHCDEAAALDADADEERRALSALRLNMPPIAHGSHLLTETTAAVQCRWLRVDEPVASPSLQLPSQASYPAQDRVQSKLYAETAASHRHRYCQRRHRASHWRRIRTLAADDAAARLLRSTRAVCNGQRAAFTGHVRDQREQRWNVHTTRGRIAENPFEHGWKLFRPHAQQSRGADPAATQQKSLRDKHASWTSTEVRAVVAKAVHAALAAAQPQPATAASAAAAAKRRHSAASTASDAPSVVSTAASRRSSVSAAAASTASSTLAAREQLKAQRRAENPFAASLHKSTLWSTPAKKPVAAASPAKATKTPAKAAQAAGTAAVKPSLQKKPSLQIFTEDKARSLQEKLHSFMMLSPIHAAAAAADNADGGGGVLVFRDLSHCVSPMATRDAVDRDDHDAAADDEDEDDVVVAVEDVGDAWPLWNLSAATVDQHAASDDVSPRVSLETTAVHPAGVPAAIAPFSPAAVKVAPPVATPSTNKAAALLALKLPHDVDLAADGDVSDDETVVVVQQQPPTAAALDTSLLIA